MPSSPLAGHQESPDIVSPQETDLASPIQDDLVAPEPPSSDANAQPVRRAKRFTLSSNRKKGAARLEGIDGAPCYLLDLPEDVLHLLLVRLPPRTLLQMGATCKMLNHALKGEAVWRQNYINHFMWDGAASDGRAREEIKVLVQGCTGVGGRGWMREALSRESMIERWTASRTSAVVHHPVRVLVHSMSLSYPPNLPNVKPPLVVGKMRASPNGSGTSSPATTPAKRGQKHDPSARTPPTLFTVGLEVSALVKSDPLTGKVSKGFWGPSSTSNYNIHPHWDPSSAPSSVFIAERSQGHMLWGLLTGSTVHTTIQSRSHATHGGRPTSVNVYSKPNDNHLGAVTAIHQPESNGSDPMKWVTGGEDGLVKYWRLNPPAGRSGKKTPTEPATITCLFSSEAIVEAFLNRAEEVRLRQTLQPDDIKHVACDVQYDTVCGVTEDGDMRVWFDVTGTPREVRVDVGSAFDFGGVQKLYMVCNENSASIIVHHQKHPNFGRYDISSDGIVKTTFYGTPDDAPLTALRPFLTPAAPISQPRHVQPTLTVVTPTSGSTTPVEVEDLPHRLAPEPDFGRFIVGGDVNGQAFIWDWENSRTVDDVVMPMRDWTAQDGKITAVDFACGLVAIGSYDGRYDVFDPLPTPPERLRGFRPPGHLTPGDLMLAASDDSRAPYHNVNELILDNDLVIAAIGRNVQTWRAGTGKGRQSGKDTARKGGNPSGGGKGDMRGHRQLDLRDLHQDAMDSHYDIQAENETHRTQTLQEQHLAAMEDLGLTDGDAALEYALMLSQQEQEQQPQDAGGSDYEYSRSQTSSQNEFDDYDEEAEAIRAVEEFERRQAELAGSIPSSPNVQATAEDPEDLAEILEMIRLAEEQEQRARG